jgi:hypothetical protein
MTTPLNSKLLRKLLKSAGDHLEGEWLLVGGTLLPAVGLDVRATVDIELIGLGEKESAQTLELMELAESLGLPIEMINPIGAFFLRKLSYKKEDLILLSEGKTAKIYRPSAHLYWKLKLGRLSETDLIDCQHYYHYCLGQKDSVDKAALKQILADALKSDISQDKKKRINSLKALL